VLALVAVAGATLVGLPVSSSATAQPEPPSLQARVAALKEALAASQANLRRYEWIQTTIVSLKGEEKSRKQQRCYYGADGVLQKVDLGSAPQPEKKRGLRGRIAARKAEELADYMKQAAGLVESYVPPDPKRIQAASDAGKVAIEMLEPGKRARINFRDYLKPGDNLGFEIDLANGSPLGLTVSSYLESPKDPVVLVVTMARLDDGTVYNSKAALDAKAKSVNVTVLNTGYLKAKQADGQ